MKTLLIALDYDPSAVKVAESGYLLARAIGAKTIFLHVISDLKVYSDVGFITIKGFFAGQMNVDTDFISPPVNAKKLVQFFLDKVKFHLGDDKIQNIIKVSNASTTILETAKEFNADFIVIGSHGGRLSENEVSVTTTQRILLGASIPLFIVPIKKRYI